MSKKVIVIGAGIAGLATAARLLSKGYQVVILEKNEHIGGKVASLSSNGFKFDLTASILMNPQNYKRLFEDLGKKHQDYFTLQRIEPNYRVFYDDKTHLDFSTELSDLLKNLETVSLKDAHGYLKFLSHGYNKYLFANKTFFQKKQQQISDSFSPLSLAIALKLRPQTSSYSYISKYIQSPKIKEFLTFQAFFTGLSPFKGPCVHSLLSVIPQAYGLWYIPGGMHSFVKALEKVVKELGGIIETDAEVKEILVAKGKAIGVKTEKSITKGDLVICSGEYGYATQNIVPPSPKLPKIDSLDYSCSAYVLYLGINKKLPQLAVHNFYLGEDFKQNIDCVFKGRLPLSPSLYIYCPSALDKTMAPQESEALNVVVRVPNLKSKPSWGDRTIRLLEHRVLKNLKKINGLADIDKHIVYKSCTQPKDFETVFNCYKGAAFGISPTVTQTNYLRPHFKSPSVDNLYFVGDSLHPGVGVSMVLLSSKHVVDELETQNTTN
ncbi:phytoene desaturase family protein [Proteinivorax hydrogeniformans]|uniref:Phytoene desaturase family protein n=1 Tax=Proteinivorax hydrogeniformans TaxID=1826727 RepID=A0AAU8HSZ9_9FIRM